MLAVGRCNESGRSKKGVMLRWWQSCAEGSNCCGQRWSGHAIMVGHKTSGMRSRDTKFVVFGRGD